jgi:SAM-dependent methyltransferase
LTSYDIFARFYDKLTNDIDYLHRADYFSQLFRRHGAQPRLIVDLACGTGSLSIALAQAGYEVIGVDRSQGMLCAAEIKNGDSNNGKAMFICQDICGLDLYGTVDAAICHLDGINHLTTMAKMRKALDRVSLFLNDGGLFIFDLNTPHKIADIYGNNTFIYDYDDIYCVWQNEYAPKTRICTFDLTFFEQSGGVYRRFDETFAEKAYPEHTVKSLLAKAGLLIEAEYDDFSFNKADEASERIIYVARKAGI